MKRLLLVPALLLSSIAIATDYNYEITPLVGYNIAEGNIKLDNYAIFGGELQYNGFDSAIKPELSVLYSKADYEASNLDTDIWRVALNGVYEFDKIGSVIPLAKAGIGYENMSDTYASENRNSPFLDVGVGAKVPFNDMIALKLEALYMLKLNNVRYDSNLAVLAGLNIAFGSKAQKTPPVDVKPEPKPAVAALIVVLDDDKDGIQNEQDKCPSTPKGKTVNYAGCCIDLDDDKDGVLNSMDKCANTPERKSVDSDGCCIDGDDDNDGVLNSMDICSNTPSGDAVNSDGCPAKLTLNINFAHDSSIIDNDSSILVQEYADFLNKHANYSTIIVGYTDSKGSEQYNKKLSQKRANAVKEMLIEKGVPEARVSSAGMGEAYSIADNSTDEGRSKNRRIEAELTRN